MKKPSQFFEEKKTWSMMKDKILKGYLFPYITKVKGLNRTIVIVDGFAGRGLYGDGTEGSPMIICKIIEERFANIGAAAIGVFIEQDIECFSELKKNLKSFEDRKMAVVVNGSFNKLATRLIKVGSDSPMFFFIDPFGIKGLEFDHLDKIFSRVRMRSTEVLVNFNYRVLVREASVTCPPKIVPLSNRG